MEFTISPVGTLLGSIFLTVPDTDAWIGADTKPPASAIFCPFKTVSPTATIGVAGAPICCDNGYTSSPLGNNSRIGLSFDKSFPSKGWTPPLNVIKPILCAPLSMIVLHCICNAFNIKCIITQIRIF